MRAVPVHEATATEEPERRRGRDRRLRLRTLALAVVVVAVWFAILLDPVTGLPVLVLLGAFGVGVAVLLAALALARFGFGLFALGDRVVGWLRHASRWPE